ncbi:hypothetical protein LUZ63_020968 [Rhynchospora breviuscula]|uniref:Citrate transporter-like domain-containing protein n=1 Tax=Rhynchospora breviuscula TaxID=2022672 RepID=A0A9Q0C0A6_9POAL|nr:hypothetical protein LUZ63_020968 [Rhynchospora breviuscula]
MGMFVVHGAQGGGFSPISIYGTITSSVMTESGLPSSEITVFLASLLINLAIAVVLFLVLGGRELVHRRIDADEGELVAADLHRGGPSIPARGTGTLTESATAPIGVRRDQVLTLVAFVAVAVVSLAFDKNIGFTAITAAVVLAMLKPQEHKDAVKQIAWPTVLLVAGVSTYATILTTAEVPEYVGGWAAGLGVAAVGALVLCYVGGVVSAFASSTALLPVIVPIAIPLIAEGGINAGLFVAALAVSSTIVDVSPFSTNGALMLANRPDSISESAYYRQILTYSVVRGRRRSAAGVGRAGAAGVVSPAEDRDPTTEEASPMTNRPDGPLGDLLVVDLTRALAGPHATMMLGDLGARVVKVEAPGLGDDTRDWGPPFVGEPDEQGRRHSTYFLSANRNKESVVLDLKDAGDRDVLLGLVDRADVLVENFRTGVLERLGLGLESLRERNPRLVALSITGFGHDGPEGGRAGYDQIAQGEAGVMSLTGADPEHPQKVGVPDRRPPRRDVRRGTRWTVAGEVGRAQGNHHPSIAPYGLFRCRDGAVQISVGSEGLWRRLCEGFGIDAVTPGLATNSERVAHREQTIAVVEAAFAEWEPDALLERLSEVGVPAGRVRSLDEVYAWEQTRSQGLLVDVEHAALGSVTLPGPPLRFFGTDGERTRRGHRAPPLLDEHGAAVRAEVAGE